MGLLSFLMVAAGAALTYYGFASAGRSAGSKSLGGALVMAVGLASTFGGLLLGLVPGFFR
jgi:hypothetical protein